MATISDEYLISDVLKPCFKQAENIKIVSKKIGVDSTNVTSVIVHLTIDYEQDGRLQRQDLLLKIPEFCAEYSSLVGLHIYDKEANVYDQVAPIFSRLLAKHIFAQHFFTKDSRTLVLENLSVQGFKSPSERPTFTLSQCYPVLRTMAEFHATSHHVHLQYPHLLSDSKFDTFRPSTLTESLMNVWHPVVQEVLAKYRLDYLIPKLEAASKFLKDGQNGLNSLCNAKNFKFVVLAHGDFRNDNLMIKYDDGGEIYDVRIIDLQTCAWTSPVIDFMYFLVLDMEPGNAETHLQSLIDCYLKYVAQTLSKLGSTHVYDKTDFMDDWHRLKVSMLLSIPSLCVILTSQQEAKGPSIFQEKDISSIMADENFVSILSDWLKCFDRLGVFDAIPS